MQVVKPLCYSLAQFVYLFVPFLQGKSSLVHSIYEVLEESVKQPCNAAFPLRVKLVVMPSLHPEKTSQIGKMFLFLLCFVARKNGETCCARSTKKL